MFLCSAARSKTLVRPKPWACRTSRGSSRWLWCFHCYESITCSRTVLQLGTHLACEGGVEWNPTTLGCDRTFLHRRFGLFGSFVKPYDSGLGDLLKTSAAQEQLFEDVRSWKPRLVVAHLPDWSAELSEFAREVALRQREQGHGMFCSGIRSTPQCCCLRVTTKWDSIWSTELWMVGSRMLLHGLHHFGGLRQRRLWLTG